MRTTSEIVKRAIRKFGLAKIVTLGELMVLLECSRRTAQRYLKHWGCVTSYNCNSSWYALPAVVDFDDNGLWRCRDARFSRYGNLVETVTGLVCASSAGLTAAELGEMLAVNPHSFISRFRSHPALQREKIGGRFVYLAATTAVRARQIAARREAECRAEQLSDGETVAVLVELIKAPDSSCAELSQRLQTHTPRATPQAIEALLRRHGLPKKRGTAHSPRRKR